VLVGHDGVTVDGLRTLAGDAEVARVLPGWREDVPAAGLTRLVAGSESVRLTSAGDVSHLGRRRT